ncbi:aminotransferase class IV [Pirellulaceae bacterium SH467]
MANRSATPLESSLTFRCTSEERKLQIFDPLAPVWYLSDIGPVWGAFLVERFRTLNGKALHLAEHRHRLQLGADYFGWSTREIMETFDCLVEALVTSNRQLLGDSGDASVVVLFSPTPSGWESIGYLLPIPFARLNHWYREGASLCSVSIPAPSADSTPVAIKHRSRLPYWVADQQAAAKEPKALALLQTHDGALADTSVANIALWREGLGWRTPMDSECHPGTTLAKTMRILAESGETVAKTSLTLYDLQEADTAVLLGSTGLVWPIARLDGESIGSSKGTAKWKELQARWIEFASFDFVAQAAAYSARDAKS